MNARALIVAAPHSGAGKTTITLALLAALQRRGIKVRAAKAGPDYIDAAFHSAVTGTATPNLDTWAMPPPLLDALLAKAAAAADIVIIEGVMGLFDGANGPPGRRGATSDLAALFRVPAILGVDISRQAQSAAALVRGFAIHDPAVRIAGVILNRVASDRHRAMVAEALAATGIPVLGALPRNSPAHLPERHLGLVQACEHSELAALLEQLAAAAERHLDIEAIMACAAAPALTVRIGTRPPLPALPPPGQRIALAQDEAFSFIYPHLTAAWRDAGAEIVTFSPLADEPPPRDADCCWLPGGYPELHAGRLAAATRFGNGLQRFAETRPVHGECGGYMVLGVGLEDAAGRCHAMTGLLGHATSFAKRKLHLGYRRARLLCDTVLGPKGAIVRGHEFHYACLSESGGDPPIAEIGDAAGLPLGQTGGRRGHVTGAFFHAIAAEDASVA